MKGRKSGRAGCGVHGLLQGLLELGLQFKIR